MRAPAASACRGSRGGRPGGGEERTVVGWVRRFFVGGPEMSRVFCERHGNRGDLARRGRGEEVPGSVRCSTASGSASSTGFTRSTRGTRAISVVAAPISPVTPPASWPKAVKATRNAASPNEDDSSPVTRNSQITASNTAEGSGVNRLLKVSWAAAQRRALSVVRGCPAKSLAQRAKTYGSALATRSWARPVNTERDAVGRRRRRGNWRGSEIPRLACSVSPAQSPLWMKVTLGEYRAFASATGGGAGRGCPTSSPIATMTTTAGGTAACFTAAPGASASSPAAPLAEPPHASRQRPGRQHHHPRHRRFHRPPLGRRRTPRCEDAGVVGDRG